MQGAAAALATLTDEQLMLRVQADDDVAFELLYDRHRNRVWRLAQLLCRTPDGAGQVAEDAFVAVWRDRADFDSGRETVQAWTVRLVHRRAGVSNEQKQLPGDQRTDDPAAGPAVPGEDRPSDAAERGLRGLLGRLPAEEREIITLAFYGGLTHSQITELLTLPPGTVQGRMRLGLHKLRDVMDEERAEGDPPG